MTDTAPPFDFASLAPEATEGLRQAWKLLGNEGEPNNDTTPAERQSKTCIHEAGHAVARYILFGGEGLYVAFVCRRGGAVVDAPWPRHSFARTLSAVHFRWARDDAAKTAVVCMAGIAAEAIFLGIVFAEAAERYEGVDYLNLDAIRRDWNLTDCKPKAEARARALMYVPSVWPAVVRVGRALNAEGFIGADRIASICNECLTSDALAWKHRFPRIEYNGKAKKRKGASRSPDEI